MTSVEAVAGRARHEAHHRLVRRVEVRLASGAVHILGVGEERAQAITIGRMQRGGALGGAVEVFPAQKLAAVGVAVVRLQRKALEARHQVFRAELSEGRPHGVGHRHHRRARVEHEAIDPNGAGLATERIRRFEERHQVAPAREHARRSQASDATSDDGDALHLGASSWGMGVAGPSARGLGVSSTDNARASFPPNGTCARFENTSYCCCSMISRMPP